MNHKDFVLALLVVTIWGANFTVIKLVLDGVPPVPMLVPVAGLLTASLVLGEQLSLLQWGGCLTVIFGLLVSTFGLQTFRRLAPDHVR